MLQVKYTWRNTLDWTGLDFEWQADFLTRTMITWECRLLACKLQPQYEWQQKQRHQQSDVSTRVGATTLHKRPSDVYMLQCCCCCCCRCYNNSELVHYFAHAAKQQHEYQLLQCKPKLCFVCTRAKPIQKNLFRRQFKQVEHLAT